MNITVYGTLTKVHHRYPDLSDKQTDSLGVQIVQLSGSDDQK